MTNSGVFRIDDGVVARVASRLLGYHAEADGVAGRSSHGSGMIRLIWKASPPKGGQ
jgi:hypothetical protein